MNFPPNPITFLLGGDFSYEKNKTLAEMEAILLTAIELPGSIKSIRAATDTKPNPLYKWKSNETAHLSP